MRDAHNVVRATNDEVVNNLWDVKLSGERSATNRGTPLKFENIKCRIKICIIDIPLLVSE